MLSWLRHFEGYDGFGIIGRNSATGKGICEWLRLANIPQYAVNNAPVCPLIGVRIKRIGLCRDYSIHLVTCVHWLPFVPMPMSLDMS